MCAPVGGRGYERRPFEEITAYRVQANVHVEDRSLVSTNDKGWPEKTGSRIASCTVPGVCSLGLLSDQALGLQSIESIVGGPCGGSYVV